jgi:hypothetical protein
VSLGTSQKLSITEETHVKDRKQHKIVAITASFTQEETHLFPSVMEEHKQVQKHCMDLFYMLKATNVLIT